MTKKNPSWMTDTIAGNSLFSSREIIDFIAKKTDKLDRVLSWQQIIALWRLDSARFSKTETARKINRHYGSMKNDKKGKLLMQGIRELVAKVPHTREYLAPRIPVRYAIELCNNVQDLMCQVFRRAKTRQEKLLCLKHVQRLASGTDFSLRSLVDYYEMTDGFPQHREMVYMLMGALIQNDPKDACKLAKHIPFTDLQTGALVNALRNNVPKLHFEFSHCLDLYMQMKKPVVLQLVLELFAKVNPSSGYVFENIKDAFSEARQDGGKLPNEIKELMLPIISKCVVTFGIEEVKNRLNLVEYLPIYVAGDAHHEYILDELVKFWGESQYRLTWENFVWLYKHAPQDRFIDLYLDGIGRHGYQVFLGATKAYKLCGDQRIIDAVLEQVLPTKVLPDDDLVDFMKWAQDQNEVTHANGSVRNQVIAKIKHGMYMHNWYCQVENADTGSSQITHYMELQSLLWEM